MPPRKKQKLTKNVFYRILVTFRKHWTTLLGNNSLKYIFQNEPITAFKRNKSLKEIIGRNKIDHKKVEKENINVIIQGKYAPHV